MEKFNPYDKFKMPTSDTQQGQIQDFWQRGEDVDIETAKTKYMAQGGMQFLCSS